MKFKQHSVIPGFGLTLGFTLGYLGLIVLIPLSLLFFKATALGWGHFGQAVTSARVIASLKLSFGTAFASAVVNMIFGLLVAWVLVRYEFPGKKIVDALVDLPFALPTAVAGIALTTLAALPAQAREELAKKHNCLACHTVDKKVVGPSYKEVAAKYRGDKAAEAKLIDKVKKGGVGVWGQIPMPPNAAVPDADTKALVQWILSQK